MMTPAIASGDIADRAKALLNDVQTREAAWQHEQEHMAAQLAPNFSPFTVYRSHEVDVSRHLQLLLDPKGTHAQGSLFWDAWVKLVLQAQHSTYAQVLAGQENERKQGMEKQHPAAPVVNAVAPASLDWLGVCRFKHVEREHRTTALAPDKSRRAIDLCVHLHGGFLAIENKPWLASVDEEEQLTDYADHLLRLAKRQQADWCLVYLGHVTPSHQSLSPTRMKELIQAGHFVCVSWGQLLAALRQCLPQIQAPKVKWFVQDFIHMMERDVMNYTEKEQMQAIAQAFNQSPEALHSAVLLRNTLQQWQASQLNKLEQQLTARCSESMRLQWNIKADAAHQKQSHFTLAFPGYTDVVMRVEWFWGYADEANFYWGVYAPNLNLEQSQTLGASLIQALDQAKVVLPATEDVEAGWPLWTFFSADPLFTEQTASEDSAAAVVHPWLSVDRAQGDVDFVSLVLQRYEQVKSALEQMPQTA